jgi:hypothetical protein
MALKGLFIGIDRTPRLKSTGVAAQAVTLGDFMYCLPTRLAARRRCSPTSKQRWQLLKNDLDTLAAMGRGESNA